MKFGENHMGGLFVAPVDEKELRQGAFDEGVVAPQGHEAVVLVQRDAKPECAGLQLTPVWLMVDS